MLEIDGLVSVEGLTVLIVALGKVGLNVNVLGLGMIVSGLVLAVVGSKEGNILEGGFMNGIAEIEVGWEFSFFSSEEASIIFFAIGGGFMKEEALIPFLAAGPNKSSIVRSISANGPLVKKSTNAWYCFPSVVCEISG